MTSPATATPPVPPAPSAASARRRPPGLGTIGRFTRPVWQTTFKDPVVDSHLNLEGCTLVERAMARIGLVTLVLLLVSVLLSDRWRAGELLPLGENTTLAFLPVDLLALTLVAFSVAWAVLCWGALAASAWIRPVVALLYLLTNAALAKPPIVVIGDHPALEHGDTIVLVGYFLTPAALVLSALLAPAKRVSRWVRPLILLAVVVGTLLLYLGQLWIHVAYVDEGFPGTMQQLVSSAITDIDALLFPLVLVSGVLIVDFSFDVADGVAQAGREAPRTVAKWLLVTLLAVKLWFSLVGEWSEWVVYVQDRGPTVARTLVAFAGLAVLVLAVTRFAPTDSFDRAKDRLLYGSAFWLALVSIIAVGVTGYGIFSITVLDRVEIPGVVSGFPAATMTDVTQIGFAAVALLLGVWLLRTRPEPALAREIGSGLVLVGAWDLHVLVLNVAGVRLGFSYELVDVALTLLLAVVVLLRWRHLDTADIAALVAILVFSWLALGQGDWIVFLGALLGLPAIVVVVVSIAYSLASDAGFTRVSSRFLPEGARTLLFIGYLVLAVTLLNWVEATHTDTLNAQGAQGGFFLLAFPWAAWLVGRRLLRDRTLGADEPPALGPDREPQAAPTVR